MVEIIFNVIVHFVIDPHIPDVQLAIIIILFYFILAFSDYSIWLLILEWIAIYEDYYIFLVLFQIFL